MPVTVSLILKVRPKEQRRCRWQSFPAAIVFSFVREHRFYGAPEAEMDRIMEKKLHHGPFQIAGAQLAVTAGSRHHSLAGDVPFDTLQSTSSI